jgi:hypothetical protein
VQGTRKLLAEARRRWAVEAFLVIAIRAAKQHATGSNPRQVRKLINGRDHEARQPAEQRFIDGDDRQRIPTAKLTACAGASDPQLTWLVAERMKLKRERLELRPAPRTVLHRNRRGPLAVALEEDRLLASRHPIMVALSSHSIRCRGLPHPQADLERPRAKSSVLLLLPNHL